MTATLCVALAAFLLLLAGLASQLRNDPSAAGLVSRTPRVVIVRRILETIVHERLIAAPVAAAAPSAASSASSAPAGAAVGPTAPQSSPGPAQSTAQATPAPAAAPAPAPAAAPALAPAPVVTSSSGAPAG